MIYPAWTEPTSLVVEEPIFVIGQVQHKSPMTFAVKGVLSFSLKPKDTYSFEMKQPVYKFKLK